MDPNSATPAVSLHQVDIQLLLRWLRTKTAQHKPSLLQDGDVRGRGDKQRESDGQPECCERRECVVVL